ncbi:MAG: protein kinase [Blastocatellia bacterium]
MDFPVLSRYRIVRRLGPESLGPVFLAEDTRLGRKLVLRTLPRDLFPDDARLLSFLNEGRALAYLNHPNIALVYDFGWEGDVCYVAREFVEGESLADLLSKREVRLKEAFAYMSQVARALAAAHRAGVVHRNIRPENIIVRPDGLVKVIAFGGSPVLRLRTVPSETARAAWVEADSSIQHKLNYMSPEELEGFEVDARTDVFSLGAVMYELFTGEKPFEGNTIRDVAVSVLTKTPTPATSFSPKLPSEAEQITNKALVKDKGQRYQTMDELADALNLLLLRETSTWPTGWRTWTGVPSTVARPPRIEKAPVSSGSRDRTPSLPIVCDENVQFTVYRPEVIRPRVWYDLLAFAHLSKRRPDAPNNEPDPVEEVKRQAQQILGDRAKAYKGSTQDSRAAVPRQDEVSFVPEIEGIEFNPPSRSFRWEETVHREDFRMRASQSTDGQVIRGRLTVWLGTRILADVTLAVRVDGSVEEPTVSASINPIHARPYRRIFASYSRKDTSIVEDFERHARVLGDEYLRDQTALRSGEVWSARLEEMIRVADVFQLFWSTNSMYSDFVRQEWQYALSLNRSSFVRPTYWQEPLPKDPARDLPPDALLRLHFQRIERGLAGSKPEIPRSRSAPQPMRVDESMLESPSASAPKHSGWVSQSEDYSEASAPRSSMWSYAAASVGLALLVLLLILILRLASC